MMPANPLTSELYTKSPMSSLAFNDFDIGLFCRYNARLCWTCVATSRNTWESKRFVSFCSARVCVLFLPLFSRKH